MSPHADSPSWPQPVRSCWRMNEDVAPSCIAQMRSPVSGSDFGGKTGQVRARVGACGEEGRGDGARWSRGATQMHVGRGPSPETPQTRRAPKRTTQRSPTPAHLPAQPHPPRATPHRRSCTSQRLLTRQRAASAYRLLLVCRAHSTAWPFPPRTQPSSLSASVGPVHRAAPSPSAPVSSAPLYIAYHGAACPSERRRRFARR